MRAYLLTLAFAGSGCVEHQFLLEVRHPGAITVSSPREPVERWLAEPAPPPASASAFPDRGVVLSDGFHFPYWREGDWISSIDPVRAHVGGALVSLAFTVHPGRRDLPLALGTSLENVCQLRLRSRPSRGLGYAALLAGATVALLVVPSTVTASDRSSRVATPYVSVGAGALGVLGAGFALWPAGEEKTVVSSGCDVPS